MSATIYYYLMKKNHKAKSDVLHSKISEHYTSNTNKEILNSFFSPLSFHNLKK